MKSIAVKSGVRFAITYVVCTLAAGCVLGHFAAKLPKQRLRDESSFRVRVWRQFHVAVQDVSIQAADDASLKAWYVQPARPNGKTVILLHGITSNRSSIAGFGDPFLRRGYAVLVPDSREHGESGGMVATYGILEREDVHRWAEWVDAQAAGQGRAPGCVYLLGESMGASIGLQASEVTPQLCAVAVESPYATFRMVSYERLGRATHLGTAFWRTLGRPAIEVAILYDRLRYGIYLPNAEPRSSVQRSRVPTLLIAGTADRDILMHNAVELQDACAGHCSLWIVQGASHGQAAVVARREFTRRVVGWFEEHDRPVMVMRAAASPLRYQLSER